MKKLSFILNFIMLVGLLSSCGAREDRFELTYESDRTLYLVGETVKITAKVTNVSGRTYTYRGGSSDYRPYVRLYPVLEDDKLGEPLEHLPIASTADMPSRHKIADGNSGQVTFEFPLPEDAHIGKYTVSLSYEGAKKVFDGAISVVRPAEQNHKDGLPYSSVTVNSGGESIYPLSGLSTINEYVNGKPGLCGDGKGVYWFLTIQSLPLTIILVLSSRARLPLPHAKTCGSAERICMILISKDLIITEDLKGFPSSPRASILWCLPNITTEVLKTRPHRLTTKYCTKTFSNL